MGKASTLQWSARGISLGKRGARVVLTQVPGDASRNSGRGAWNFHSYLMTRELCESPIAAMPPGQRELGGTMSLPCLKPSGGS